MVERVSSVHFCACGCGQEVNSGRTYVNGHNMKGAHRGASNPLWRGDAVGYSALHKWAARHFEKSGICEHCEVEKKTEWASVDQTPRRDRQFWMELCRSCHWKYDGRIQNIIGRLRFGSDHF